MRPVRKTQTGVGASTPVPLDNYISPFDVGIGVTVTGTATYTVQFTFDDVQAKGYNPATGAWFDSPDTAVAGATTNGASNIAFPVTAVRVNVTAGTGTVQLVVIQAGGGV